MLIVAGQPNSRAERLVAALAEHPEVAFVPNDGLVGLAFLRQRVSDPQAGRRLAADLIASSASFSAGLGRHLDRAAVESAIESAPYHLAGITAAVYDAYAAAAGVRVAGFRLAALGLPILNRSGLWNPEVRVVHVVRDIRRIVADGVPDAERAIRRWDTANLAFSRRVRDSPSPYLLVRHEDPDAAALQTFLGVTRRPIDLPAPPGGKPPAVSGAREGLYEFGYDPPPRSIRRKVQRAARLTRRVANRVSDLVAHSRDRSWARRAPSPWAEAEPADEVAPAWCNVCRWSGASFDPSGPCPRCGSAAARRFLLRCLTERVQEGARVAGADPGGDAGWRRFVSRWFGSGAPADVVVSAEVLQRAADPSEALAGLAADLGPGGRLLVQVPVVIGSETVALVGAAANPLAEHWQFGVDLADRMDALEFDVTVLVTDRLAQVDEGADPMLDVADLVAAVNDRPQASVASAALARRCGFDPATRFVAFEGVRR